VTTERLDILVVAPYVGSTFIERDVEILRRSFSVERIGFRECGGKLPYLRDFARCVRERRPRLVLLWFLAPSYSLETIAISRLRKIRVAVIAGGLEVDYVPELRLGGLKWPHNRLRQRIGLRAADLVLTPSEFLAEKVRRLAQPHRLETVYNALDVARFTPGGEPKERLALTVCFEVSRRTAVLKGLPAFLGAAALLPDVEFVVVGRSGGDDTLARLQDEAPPNVAFSDGFIPDDELVGLYRRAKVYVQVSAHEAFGVAVAESIACGCVPVLADQGALHEVAGDAALYVPFGSPEETARAIRAALEVPDADALRARPQVVDRFSVEDRAERLVQLLGPLVHGAGR